MTKRGLLLLRGPILWTPVIPNSDQCDQISRNEVVEKIRKNVNKALAMAIEFLNVNQFEFEAVWLC